MEFQNLDCRWGPDVNFAQTWQPHPVEELYLPASPARPISHYRYLNNIKESAWTSNECAGRTKISWDTIKETESFCFGRESCFYFVDLFSKIITQPSRLLMKNDEIILCYSCRYCICGTCRHHRCHAYHSHQAVGTHVFVSRCRRGKKQFTLEENILFSYNYLT